MPLAGIMSSGASMSQAEFDRLKRDITLNGTQIPIRTESGPGGGPVFTNTVRSMNGQIRGLVANGSSLLRLAPAQFESHYAGHLLDQAYHMLHPNFGGQKVDFHA